MAQSDIGLASRICAVRGASHAALYDFSRSQIQRIPLSLLDAIELGLGRDQYVGPIRELTARGFVDLESDGLPKYLDEKIFPDLPAIRLLSVDVRALNHSDVDVERIVELIRECAVHGLREVLLAASGPLDKHCLQFVAHVREILHDVDFSVAVAASSLSSAAPSHSHRVARRIASSADSVHPKQFRIDWTYFTLLKNRSESDGCIHIDEQLNVSPDIGERYVRIDLPSLLQNLRIVGSPFPSFEGYWSRGKSVRSKCQDCEFRFACPNGKWSRSHLDDLDSAPENCFYDPVAGAWR